MFKNEDHIQKKTITTLLSFLKILATQSRNGYDNYITCSAASRFYSHNALFHFLFFTFVKILSCFKHSPLFCLLYFCTFSSLNNLLMAYEDKSAYTLCAFSLALGPDVEPISFLGKTPVCFHRLLFFYLPFILLSFNVKV